MLKRLIVPAFILAANLAGCGPSIGVGVGGMPMGYGMMGMPMGGFYGGSYGHTNVYTYNHTTDVYASNHNNAFVDNHAGGDFYHPGHGR
jgi:hypothetical protein